MTETNNKLQLVMGMEFNECSIASAELAGRVQDIMDNPEYQSEKQVFLMQGANATQVLRTVVPVSDVFQSETGRDIQYYLMRQPTRSKAKHQQQDQRTYLMAVTRGDVAFTVASFARRHGSYCDYVQIGDEMTDESLVVTPQDEQSRKDVIEAMRRVLDADPTQWVYRDLIEDARNNASNEAALAAAEKEHDSIIAVDKIYIMHKANKKEASIRSAIMRATTTNDTSWSWYGSASHTFSTRMHYKKATQELEEFFSNPSFKPLIEGKVPGSHDPETRRLLIKKVATMLFGDTATTYYPTDARRRDQTIRDYGKILSSINMVDAMDASLGQTTRAAENLVNIVGKLASLGSEFKATRHDVDFNTTKGDVDLFVKVVPKNVRSFGVDIFARPTAMSDRAASQVYGFVVDRCVALDLCSADVAEVADILKELT